MFARKILLPAIGLFFSAVAMEPTFDKFEELPLELKQVVLDFATRPKSKQYSELKACAKTLKNCELVARLFADILKNGIRDSFDYIIADKNDPCAKLTRDALDKEGAGKMKPSRHMLLKWLWDGCCKVTNATSGRSLAKFKRYRRQTESDLQKLTNDVKHSLSYYANPNVHISIADLVWPCKVITFFLVHVPSIEPLQILLEHGADVTYLFPIPGYTLNALDVLHMAKESPKNTNEKINLIKRYYPHLKPSKFKPKKKECLIQ